MKHISLCILSLLTIFTAFGQGTAHQSVLYVQTLGEAAATESQVLVNTDLIRQQLASIANCGMTINIIVTSQDIELTVEGNNLIGPNYEGNSIWMDETVDWLILIEPGPGVVTLYGKDGNGAIKGWISGGAGNDAIGDMLEASMQMKPYPNKNYCIVKAGLDALACPAAGHLSANGCSGSLESPTDVVNTDLEPHLVEGQNIIDPGVKDYFMAHYCTPIVVVASNRIEPFERASDNELPAALIDNIKNALGYEEFLLFIKERGEDPNSINYVLKAHLHTSTTANQEGCLSLARQLTAPQIAALEGKSLTMPTFTNGELDGNNDNALVFLDEILRGQRDGEEGDELCPGLGKITEVRTYCIENGDVSQENDIIEIHWNLVPGAADYFVTLIKSPEGLLSQYTSNLSSSYYREENGFAKLKVTGANFDGGSTSNILRSTKLEYTIMPICANVSTQSVFPGRTSLPFAKGIMGEQFQHQNQRVCEGQSARLGIAYAHDRTPNPCLDNQLHPQVDPALYDFTWSNKTGENVLSGIGNDYQDCENAELRYRSRTVHTPNEDGIYILKREYKNGNNLLYRPDPFGDITAILELDEINITDYGEVFLDAIKQGDSNWSSSCSFYLVMRDRTRTAYPRIASTDGTGSFALELVRDNSDGDGYELQALPGVVSGTPFAEYEPTWRANSISLQAINHIDLLNGKKPSSPNSYWGYTPALSDQLSIYNGNGSSLITQSIGSETEAGSMIYEGYEISASSHFLEESTPNEETVGLFIFRSTETHPPDILEDTPFEEVGQIINEGLDVFLEDLIQDLIHDWFGPDVNWNVDFPPIIVNEFETEISGIPITGSLEFNSEDLIERFREKENSPWVIVNKQGTVNLAGSLTVGLHSISICDIIILLLTRGRTLEFRELMTELCEQPGIQNISNCLRISSTSEGVLEIHGEYDEKKWKFPAQRYELELSSEGDGGGVGGINLIDFNLGGNCEPAALAYDALDALFPEFLKELIDVTPEYFSPTFPTNIFVYCQSYTGGDVIKVSRNENISPYRFEVEMSDGQILIFNATSPYNYINSISIEDYDTKQLVMKIGIRLQLRLAINNHTRQIKFTFVPIIPLYYKWVPEGADAEAENVIIFSEGDLNDSFEFPIFERIWNY